MNSSGSWATFHHGLGTGTELYLDLTQAATNSNFWQTSPTSTVVTINGGTAGNTSGQNHLMYAFSAVAGYSKFGTYTGNGSSDGAYVALGFRPAWVMYKCSSHGTDGWYIQDSTRSPDNVTQVSLQVNGTQAESGENIGDMLSNGFKIRIGGNNNFNGSGRSYVYWAFAESPFKIARAR